MRICIAQAKAASGKIQKNIENHLLLIESAIKLNADLIVFPELSITGYEPELAKALAMNMADPILNPFQQVADQHKIAIGVGLPTKSQEGINISMLIFLPDKKRILYSKEMLHEDELAYFVCGNNPPFININGKKIAIGICYETLQRAHFLKANMNGAEIYIASVAKPEKGIEKAYVHFPSIAKEFQIPILMSNCVDFCDNFLSTGQSAVWNEKGVQISQLDNKCQGIIVYDTELKNADKNIIIE